MDLMQLADGAVLVNSVALGETLCYIDSAWAPDMNGNCIPTHFISSGDTLIQVVDGSRLANSIVADPIFAT